MSANSNWSRSWLHVLRVSALPILLAAFLHPQMAGAADSLVLDPKIAHKMIIDMAERGPTEEAALIAMKSLGVKAEKFPLVKNKDGSRAYYIKGRSSYSESEIKWVSPEIGPIIIFRPGSQNGFQKPCVSYDEIKEEIKIRGWSIIKDDDFSHQFLSVELEKNNKRFLMSVGSEHCVLEVQIKIHKDEKNGA